MYWTGWRWRPWRQRSLLRYTACGSKTQLWGGAFVCWHYHVYYLFVDTTIFIFFFVDTIIFIFCLLTPSYLSFVCWHHHIFLLFVDTIIFIFCLLTPSYLSFVCIIFIFVCWHHHIYLFCLLTLSCLSFVCWHYHVYVLLNIVWDW